MTDEIEQSDQDTPTLIRAARIDADGIYQGMDELPADELTGLHLAQIRECDLPAGKYRWDHDAQTFRPAKPRTPDEITPDAQRAIALGFIAMLQGRPCPAETIAWLKNYTDSFDFKGE